MPPRLPLPQIGDLVQINPRAWGTMVKSAILGIAQIGRPRDRDSLFLLVFVRERPVRTTFPAILMTYSIVITLLSAHGETVTLVGAIDVLPSDDPTERFLRKTLRTVTREPRSLTRG